MSGWDNPSIVTERLRPALQSRGIVLSSFSTIISSVAPLCGHSGLSGDMSLLTLTVVTTVKQGTGDSGIGGSNANATAATPSAISTENNIMKFVLKRTRSTEEGKQYSKKLGLYREGAFYNTIGPWVQQRLDNVQQQEQQQQDQQQPNNPSSTSSSTPCQRTSFIPQALFAASDSNTGQKAIVLDYYDHYIEAGVFFPHSVHNVVRKMENNETQKKESKESNDPPLAMEIHGKNDDNMQNSNDKANLTKSQCNAKNITLEATRIAASIHGSFYNDLSLLNDSTISPHLRMADWIQGRNRESFLLSQQEVCDRWTHVKTQWEKGEWYGGQVTMEKEWVDIMDASCALALDFDSFVDKWNVTGDCNAGRHDKVDASRCDGRPNIGWSLVHGDYHPGNLLCQKEMHASSAMPQLILIDWEVVGIGSGPQDIGQFLISHMKTQYAVKLLDAVVSVYRNSLIKTLQAVNPAQILTVPSLDDLKKEIVYGGLERWVWLFGYMCGFESSMPPVYMQYFHDQLYGWVVKNGITAKNVGMPRP